MPRKKPAPIDIIHACSHPNRWAILSVLDKPLSGSQIAELTGLSTHNIVWHAKELRRHGLVSVKHDKALPTRLIYTRTPFLAELVVDYGEIGTEVTFTKG